MDERRDPRYATGERGSLKRYLLWGTLFWGGLATAVYVALMLWIADMPLWRVVLAPLVCFVLAGAIWGFLAWLLRPRRQHGTR